MAGVLRCRNRSAESPLINPWRIVCAWVFDLALAPRRKSGGAKRFRGTCECGRNERGEHSVIDLSKLTPGREGHSELVVGDEHTAPRIGSGRVRVLATPVMINLMEAAALDAVENLIPA